jgi:uncharacterized protein (TIGR03067 family)
MRRLVSTFVVAAVIGAAVLHAQGPGALVSLQGRWLVTGGEHNGKPMEAIKGGVLTITGTSFEIRTASGNLMKGTLSVDTTMRPLQMDLVHTNGTRWEAIYEAQPDALWLNYVQSGGKDPRPVAFKTSEKTEESIVTLRRETP